MAYPFPGYGGFMFKQDEQPVWGTDVGWTRTPSYSRQTPLGSAADVVTTMAIGSAERTFEMYLTEARFASLEMLLGSKALFTDWKRPRPDSRMSVLFEVSPLEYVISQIPGGIAISKRRTRLTFVSVS